MAIVTNYVVKTNKQSFPDDQLSVNIEADVSTGIKPNDRSSPKLLWTDSLKSDELPMFHKRLMDNKFVHLDNNNITPKLAVSCFVNLPWVERYGFSSVFQSSLYLIAIMILNQSKVC
jgi:hypothetical protein